MSLNLAAVTLQLDKYFDALAIAENNIQLDSRTSPEDQLKKPVAIFLEDIAAAFGTSIQTVTEHRQVKGDAVEGVRLDIAVKSSVGSLLGHVELKAPSKSANPEKPFGWSKHDKNQWKNLSQHPNLLYCNGLEWTLLRQGSSTPLAHVLLDPSAPEATRASQLKDLAEMINLFLGWAPLVPSSPKGLAEALAPLSAFCVILFLMCCRFKKRRRIQRE